MWVDSLIVEAQLAARDKEIKRLNDSISDTNIFIEKISADNSALRNAIINMHNADKAFGVGFYGDPDWNLAYDLTKDLVSE